MWSEMHKDKYSNSSHSSPFHSAVLTLVRFLVMVTVYDSIVGTGIAKISQPDTSFCPVCNYPKNFALCEDLLYMHFKDLQCTLSLFLLHRTYVVFEN